MNTYKMSPTFSWYRPIRKATFIMALAACSLSPQVFAEASSLSAAPENSSQPALNMEFKGSLGNDGQAPKAQAPDFKFEIKNTPDGKTDAEVLADRIKDEISRSEEQASLGYAIKQLIVVFGLFVAPFLLVFALAKIKSAERIKRQQSRDALIEKFLAEGKDVPVEILCEFTNNNEGLQPNADLRKGIMNIATGLGLGIILASMFQIEAASIGLIFVLLGISRLFLWKYANKTEASYKQ